MDSPRKHSTATSVSKRQRNLKVIRVILSKEAHKKYTSLQTSTNKKETSLLESINTKIAFLKKDIHYGQAIAKRLFPKKHMQQFSITNLFRIELSSFHRMLYTITNNKENKNEIVIFILEIVSHKKYNKLFNYKRK